MRRYILAASVSAIGLALGASTTSFAQDSGVYIRGNVGAGLHTDIEVSGGMNSAGHGDGDAQSELDVAYSLGVGYDFGNNWRLELDGDSLWTDMGAIGNASNTYAKLRTNSLMVNALYDFDLGAIEPYIGAGLGIVESRGSLFAADFVDSAGNAVANPICPGAREADQVLTCDVSDSDTSFGWQLLAGFGVPISENLTWDTHGTYMDAGSADLEGVRVLADAFIPGVQDAGDGATSSPLIARVEDIGAYTVMTGLRYKFGQRTPPPAPVVVAPAPVTVTCWDGSVVTSAALCPPEPAPEPTTFTCEGSGQVVTDLALCPPRVDCPDGSIVYGSVEFCPRLSTESVAELCGQEFRQEIIYYEFDRGQSAETRNTINRILDIGQFCQVDNIRVIGHTDTSGAASYNLNLSKRRAKDAVDELVRQGINRAIISSEGKGETEPFVQTGDGVKEQLNRRTEVLIQLSEVGTDQLMSN